MRSSLDLFSGDRSIASAPTVAGSAFRALCSGCYSRAVSLLVSQILGHRFPVVRPVTFRAAESRIIRKVWKSLFPRKGPEMDECVERNDVLYQLARRPVQDHARRAKTRYELHFKR